MNTSVAFVRCKFQLGCLFFLVLLPLLVYFNSLKGSFHFDDQSLLSRNWISNIDQFRKDVALGSFESRPILLLTYALNNTLHPQKVFGFHLINLLLHVLVSILIFHILRRTQLFLAQESGTGLSGLPLVAAFLFALHPLNTDAVSYISSRSSILATFFYLLTVYGFLSIFLTRTSKYRRAVMVFFCILGFYLSLASKLIAVTLPVLIGIWFLLIGYRQKEPKRNFLSLDRQTLFIGAGLVFLAALFSLVLRDSWSPRDQGMLLFGRGAYFLLQTKVIVFYYIKQFFFPINLNVDVGFPFSSFLSDIEIPLSMATIAAIILCVFKWGNLFLKMGTIWFFVTLLPTSSFVPLNDLAVEHHTYLPLSLGLCLIAAGGIVWTDRTRRLSILIFLFLGLLAVARNGVWLDDFTLWKDSAEKNPLSPRTQNNLGKAWYEQAVLAFARGEPVAGQNARNQALAHFEKSIANLSGYGDRFYNKKSLSESLEQLASPGLKKQPILPGARLLADFSEPHYNIASLYLDLGRYADAEREYLAVIGIDPNFFSAYFGLGSVYNQTGNYEEAIHWYKQAVERRKAAADADDPLIHLNLGEVYGKTRRYAEATAELKQAIQISPSLDKAYYNLGVVYTQLSEYENAKQAYLTALQLNDSFAEARFNLGDVYLQLKQYDLVIETFEEALRRSPRGLAVLPRESWLRRQLGLIYWEIRKDKDKALKHLERALDIDPGRAEEISKLIQKISAS